MLHNDKGLFEQLVLRASEYLGIKAEIIEKDYYVTLFLKELVCVMPEIIFKGGTSLSKCYHLIDRFSEVIDLNIETETKPSEGKRKRMKSSIVGVIEKLNFTLTNSDNVKSRREYNRYIIDYPSVLGANYLREMLIVETAVYQRAYPTVRKQAGSLIYDYLSGNDFSDFAKKFDLEPFELNAQAAIDKLYALADYYLAGTIAEHSRHIYDIYKLLSVVEINDDLKSLAVSVTDERQSHSRSLSVQEGVSVKNVLREIIDKRVYAEDYNTITSALLFESVSYETAVEALDIVLSSGLFY